MKKIKYIALAVFIIPIIISLLINDKPVQLGIIGIVAVISFIILFPDLLEKTRPVRTARWMEIKGSKKRNAALYAITFGFPISLILCFILSNKMYLFEHIVFIIIPVTLMFGWIGANEWNQCYKIFLEKKYSTKL